MVKNAQIPTTLLFIFVLLLAKLCWPCFVMCPLLNPSMHDYHHAILQKHCDTLFLWFTLSYWRRTCFHNDHHNHHNHNSVQKSDSDEVLFYSLPTHITMAVVEARVAVMALLRSSDIPLLGSTRTGSDGDNNNIKTT